MWAGSCAEERVWRLNKLVLVGKNDIYAYSYQALDTRLFWKAMHKVEGPPTEFVFIDIGSGKGKLLIVASRLRFQKVIGVEFSPQLVKISKTNLAKWQPRCRFEIICGDAADYEFPPANLTVNFYNPFEEPILRKVLARLRQSLEAIPCRAYVFYFGPHHEVVQEFFPLGLADSVFVLLAVELGDISW